MTNDKPYIKKDLIDWADSGKLAREHNRASALEAVLPEDARVHYEKSGGYQGDLVLIIECADYIWVHLDSYGSCSHCDAFLSDRENWTEKMLREAYCFETVSDAREYLDNTDDWGWSADGLKEAAHEILDEISGDYGRTVQNLRQKVDSLEKEVADLKEENEDFREQVRSDLQVAKDIETALSKADFGGDVAEADIVVVGGQRADIQLRSIDDLVVSGNNHVVRGLTVRNPNK